MINAQGKQAHRCAAHTMLVWHGLKLQVCVARPRKAYIIQSCTPLSNARRRSKLLSCQMCSYNEVKDVLRLSHCWTFAQCQGTDFEESLTLHEPPTRHTFTLRHSRSRVSGNNEDFEFALHNNIHIPEGSMMVVGTICIPNNMYTITGGGSMTYSTTTSKTPPHMCGPLK